MADESQETKRCRRCTRDATQWLEFSSARKTTRVDVCDECMNEIRTVFNAMLVQCKDVVIK